MIVPWLITLCAVASPTVMAFHSYNPGENSDLFPVDSLLDPGSAFPFGGNAPVARTHHTLVHNADYLFVYGGYSSNGTLLGDMNLYHVPSQTWSNPVRKLACCDDQDEMFDSIGADQEFNVPFLRPGFEGDYPAPRAEHSACVIQDEMFLFGGITSEYGFVNDLYKFNALTMQWTTLDRTTGKAVPRRRAGHTLIADASRGQFYLFGGRTTTLSCVTQSSSSHASIVALADVWAYVVSTNSWFRLDDPEDHRSFHRPSGREHVASYGMLHDSFYLFGGSDPSVGLLYNELWRFSVIDGSWSLLSPGVVGVDPIHSFSPPPLAHSHLFPALCPIASTAAKMSASMLYDAMNQCEGLLIYGGRGSGGACGGSPCNETHSTLGQLYLFSFQKQSWQTPFFDVHDLSQTQTASSSQWLYARLTCSLSSVFTVSAESDPIIRREERGKFVKTYALEKVTYIPEKKVFFEFGGVQVQDAQAMRNGQESSLYAVDDGVNVTVSGQQRDAFTHHTVIRAPETIALDSGGQIRSVYSDTQTGEGLHSHVSLPSTSYWQSLPFDHGSMERENRTQIDYLRVLRSFGVSGRDVVLFQEDVY